MTVFKNYFKIVKKSLPTIIMYTVIFLFFAVFATQNSNTSTEFSASKTTVAIINHDQDSTFIQAFKKYVESVSELVELEDNDTKMNDALFFRNVDYILIIPENYTEDLMALQKPIIETMKVPDSISSTFNEMLLNQYLNYAEVYVEQGFKEDELVSALESDMQKTTELVFEQKQSVDVIDNMRYFFNFSNYTILALSLFVMSMTLASFQEINVRKRNIISAMSQFKYNVILFISNFLLVFCIWLMYIILGIIMFKEAMFTELGLYLILNTFVFMISAFSLAFLVGNITTKKEAVGGIANVISLGTSFICGAFVPQSMLNKTVLTIGKVFPSYWFINNNDILAETGVTQTIFTNLLIILGISVIYFVIMLFLNKKKQRIA